MIQNLTEPILVGFDNIGAKFYMNPTIQNLSNITLLSNYFLKKYQINPNNKNKIMSDEYYQVLKNLRDRKYHNKSYAPYSFKNALSKENIYKPIIQKT